MFGFHCYGSNIVIKAELLLHKNNVGDKLQDLILLKITIRIREQKRKIDKMMQILILHMNKFCSKMRVTAIWEQL